MLHEPLLPVSQRLTFPAVSFAPTGYFHWLLEVLPAALYALDIEPRARLLIPTQAPSYVEEAARWLGCRVVRADSVIQADDLLLPGIEPFSGFVHSGDAAALRRKFSVDATGQGAIYVSRRRDRKRFLSNEAEVEDAMRAAGVAVVYAQDLSFVDQVSLFAGVQQVIAPHGAGLANIVWGRRLGSVIELFPANLTNDCYARLARSLGWTTTTSGVRPTTGAADWYPSARC